MLFHLAACCQLERKPSAKRPKWTKTCTTFAYLFINKASVHNRLPNQARVCLLEPPFFKKRVTKKGRHPQRWLRHFPCTAILNEIVESIIRVTWHFSIRTSDRTTSCLSYLHILACNHLINKIPTPTPGKRTKHFLLLHQVLFYRFTVFFLNFHIMYFSR